MQNAVSTLAEPASISLGKQFGKSLSKGSEQVLGCARLKRQNDIDSVRGVPYVRNHRMRCKQKIQLVGRRVVNAHPGFPRKNFLPHLLAKPSQFIYSLLRT